MASGPFGGPRAASRGEIGELVRALEEALADKVDEVHRREDLVAAAQQSLEAEKAAMSAMGARSGDVLRLNVGGTLHSTKRSTLTQLEGSVLEGMFSGRWEKSLDVDEDGRIFLDFDPECFGEVLHQLRLLQLTGRREVDWSKVAAPERKNEYFRAMLDYLGLARLPGSFVPKFAFFHPSIGRTHNDTRVLNPSTGHTWAVGDTVMEAGCYTWGIKIHSLEGNHWIMLGVIASTQPEAQSFSDATSFGWACIGQVFMKGTNTVGHGGWSGYNAGDEVTMHFDVDNGLLRMKVARVPNSVFSLTGLGRAAWRIHVNMHGNSDHAELCSVQEF